MKITATKSNVRKIKPGDPKFNIVDGLVMTGRAGIEISQRCPENYRDLIQECIRHGWLKPVAYVRDAELFWETFHE